MLNVVQEGQQTPQEQPVLLAFAVIVNLRVYLWTVGTVEPRIMNANEYLFFFLIPITTVPSICGTSRRPLI